MPLGLVAPALNLSFSQRPGSASRAAHPQVHVHMLRHACGYALANQGHDTRTIQDWLGHRAIDQCNRFTRIVGDFENWVRSIRPGIR
jgi:site-specific recombinase XerD